MRISTLSLLRGSLSYKHTYTSTRTQAHVHKHTYTSTRTQEHEQEHKHTRPPEYKNTWANMHTTTLNMFTAINYTPFAAFTHTCIWANLRTHAHQRTRRKPVVSKYGADALTRTHTHTTIHAHTHTHTHTHAPASRLLWGSYYLRAPSLSGLIANWWYCQRGQLFPSHAHACGCCRIAHGQFPAVVMVDSPWGS